MKFMKSLKTYEDWSSVKSWQLRENSSICSRPSGQQTLNHVRM
ncbi:hypothetical protein WM42_0752 [Corynebacterium simulans]|nr:hypothetical protein WM42_0752 [Corynebacterium simulans]